MENFEYYTPTRVLFGKDTQKETARLIREAGGKKVLLHYGGFWRNWEASWMGSISPM